MVVDEENVRNILVKNKKSTDIECVKKWLSEFGKLSEHKGILYP